MTERMTDEQLAEIQARADASFRAPWTYEDFTVECRCEADECDGEQEVIRIESPHAYPDGQVICDVYGLEQFAGAHGKFIAAARDDVPALVAEARRARASEAAMVELLSTLVYWQDRGHIDESWWDVARQAVNANAKGGCL